MRPGDRVVAVGDAPTVFMGHNELVALLRTHSAAGPVSVQVLGPCRPPLLLPLPATERAAAAAAPVDEFGFELPGPPAAAAADGPASNAVSSEALAATDSSSSPANRSGAAARSRFPFC